MEGKERRGVGPLRVKVFRAQNIQNVQGSSAQVVAAALCLPIGRVAYSALLLGRRIRMLCSQYCLKAIRPAAAKQTTVVGSILPGTRPLASLLVR